MSSIFLSHSRKDNAIAAQVKACLEQWGHRSVFLDFDPADGIPAGRDWERELYTKLRECRAVIILCSQASMASRWCFSEMAYAKGLGKEVFPIKIDDAKVDPILTGKQIIDATAGWDQAYQRLEKGLLAAGLDPKGMFNWDGTRPPYPGLMAFQEQDAAIFFGRDTQIRDGQALLNRLRQFGGPRLTLVLGASGSGKSSLMRAGLLPRLKRDQRWIVVDPFRPLKAPFDELAKVLSQRFAQVLETKEGTVTDAAYLRERIGRNEQESKQSVDAFLELLNEMRETVQSREATVLLMIDQCEELMAVGANEEGERFLEFLRAALDREDSRLMVLATLRSDYLGSFQDHSAMWGFKNVEMFTVPQMAVDEFASVIEGPARLAGLELGSGLVPAMMNDTRTPGALPLLAFTLRELWEGFGQDKLLTLEEYRDKLGRLEGCIARAAEAVFKAKPLSERETSDLQDAFLSMVRVGDKNQYAKQQARWNSLPDSIHEVLERFVAARLLISSGNESERSIEIAHEALLRSWPKLKEWIDKSGDDLRLIDFEEECAMRWDKKGRGVQDLWSQEQAVALQRALTRSKKTPSSLLQIRLQPQQMLIDRLCDMSLSHLDRLLIGQKLAEFGDPRSGVGVKDGLPDIDWINIPAGEVKLDEIDHMFQVNPFRIAKYPVTNAQFEAFLKAEDGYRKKQWWRNIEQSNEAEPPSWQETNAPRETISWHQAVAFCRWLSAKTKTSIRLPTEWEWQQAATGGDHKRTYPWKGKWDGSRCNSYESRLNRTTAVGMYPYGASRQGVLDMAGSIAEWCLNKYVTPEQPEAVRIDKEGGYRVLRGGSWYNGQEFLRTSDRGWNDADVRLNSIGFRLAQDVEP